MALQSLLPTSKVLVTGASGYLAGHVVQQLQEAGHVVRGTVRGVLEDKVRPLYGLCPKARHPLQLVQADLLQPDGWTAAVEGMDYVIHMASSVPLRAPKREEEVIRPAVEGTLNVLRACAKTPSVKRVVLTSSCAAVDYSKAPDSLAVSTESDWTDAGSKRVGAYARSKTLAEKAAWQYVAAITAPDNKFELAVINPSCCLGPLLHKTMCSSVEIIKTLLEGAIPSVPRVHLSAVDVRDVAEAHIKAMLSPGAAGRRHLVVARSLWMRDVARLLDCVFRPQGYDVPTGSMSKWLLWLGSFFNADARMTHYFLDVQRRYDDTRMREVLEISPRDVRDSIIETAYSAIEAGLIKRTEGYRGPGGPEERQRYLALQLETAA